MSRAPRTALAALLCLIAGGCGDRDVAVFDAPAPDASADGSPTPVPALVGLPRPQLFHQETELFASVDACAVCHVAGSGLWTDSADQVVSPVGMWRSSLMAHAARDPYWLAAFAHERSVAPAAAADLVADTCTRCHAPAANETARRAGTVVDPSALLASLDDTHELGREGVTCTVCHQILAENLGTASSFTGGFAFNDERLIYGPLPDPYPNAMLNHVDYRPVEAEHIGQSALCATCHTVMTRSLDASGAPTGPVFAEQTPYLEWRNSDFSTETAGTGSAASSCQSCHMPHFDEYGVPITSRVSQMPDWLAPRENLSRHALHGGNAWMLELIAANRIRLGAQASESALLASAERDAALLRSAAHIDIVDVRNAGGRWEVVAEVRNRTGHRFPTGYPSRRAWIELEVTDATGATVFHSGAWRADGSLVGVDERPDGVPEHIDPIADARDVALYAATPVASDGVPARSLFSSARYGVDTRLLPAGWERHADETGHTWPVGVDDDPDFVAGSDRQTWVLPPGAEPAALTARLWYQSTSPNAIARIDPAATPEGAMFLEMVEGTPPLPRLVGSASWPQPR